MAWKNNIPEWKNEGVQPPDDLIEKGYQVKQKPPAAFFNWFWSKVTKAINEIQNAVSNIQTTASNLATDKLDRDMSNYEGATIYTVNNKPTADDIGALPIAGGVMTGQGFYVNNKSGRILGNQNGMWLRTASSDVDNNKDSRHFKLWNATYQTDLTKALAMFDTTTGKDYLIYGQHNLPYACQVKYGTYTGADAYGSANPNRLDFDFKPKLVIIKRYYSDNSTDYRLELIYGESTTSSWKIDTDAARHPITVSWGSNYVEWYYGGSDVGNKAPYWQHNAAITYRYIAIG